MRPTLLMCVSFLCLSTLACEGPAQRACEGECGEQLCSTVQAYESSGDGDGDAEPLEPGQGELFVDGARLDCALEALRDRTPGRLSWDYTPSGLLGSIQGEVCIDEAGGIRHQTTTYDDLDINHSAVVYGEPKSPEQYANCLDPSTSPRARLDCLMAEPVEIERTCEEARWEDALQ